MMKLKAFLQIISISIGKSVHQEDYCS